jgi:hypothetical protein
MNPHVMLAVPTYDGWVHHGHVLSTIDALQSGVRLSTVFIQTSLLTKGFNQLWCEALNRRKPLGLTHFLMVHSDIAIVTDSWLKKMLSIADEYGADVLSAVSPMKTADGLTSTAIELGEPFPVKRYTLYEVHAGPATWTHEKLLVNTGVMLVDFRKPWVERIRFTNTDEILEREGKYEARSLPEDWQFSRDARALGAQVFATREIRVEHFGSLNYSSGHAWGRLKEDRVSV